MTKKRFMWSAVLLWAILSCPGFALALTVAVRPLEVYSAPDLEAMAPGLQSVLASRLSGEGYQVLTTRDGEPSDASWSVKTTITRLGARYSIDAAMEPVVGPGTVIRAFQTADSMDAILPALEAVAAKLRESLVRFAAAQPPAPTAASAATTAPAPAPAAPPPPTPAAPQPAAPEAPRALSPPAEPARPEPLLNQAAMDLLLGQALRVHRLGPSLEGEARSLAVADLNGDGTPEILVLLDDEIVAFRDEKGSMSLLWKVAVPGRLESYQISAADIDGNGLPEVFVAGLDGTSPASQAFQWSGTALVPHGDRIEAFVRAVRHPERGALLMGAEPGAGKSLFSPGIRSFVWSNGRYRPGDPVQAPESAAPLNIDWHRLEDGKPPFGVVIVPADRLRIYNEADKLLYETVDEVKGTISLLTGEQDNPYGFPGPIHKIQGRTVSWKAPNGSTYLFLQKNFATVSRVFEQGISFSSGQILAFRWDGLTLLPAGEGPKIPNYITDIDIFPQTVPAGSGDKSSHSVLYGVLVQKEGTIFTKKTSKLLAYDLPTTIR